MAQYDIIRRPEPDPIIYEVMNSDGTKLRFTGELVASVSSELPEKDRWTTFDLYLSDFNTWILQGVGRSRIQGERSRFWYVVSSDPSDWLNKILNDDVKSSRLAKKLLCAAFMYLRDCGDEDE